MWKIKWYNGYEVEKPAGLDPAGNAVYLRDYFPGNPFRKNKFNNDLTAEKPICTPAVIGSGFYGAMHQPQILTFFFGMILITLYSYL